MWDYILLKKEQTEVKIWSDNFTLVNYLRKKPVSKYNFYIKCIGSCLWVPSCIPRKTPTLLFNRRFRCRTMTETGQLYSSIKNTLSTKIYTYRHGFNDLVQINIMDHAARYSRECGIIVRSSWQNNKYKNYHFKYLSVQNLRSSAAHTKH